MRYAFINAHKDTWPVVVMADLLDVSTAGYYAWRERPPSQRQQRRDALLVQIRTIHERVEGRYGSPRIHAASESFFATLKKELVHHEDYATRAEAKASVFECIEVFYNRQRRHSMLGYLSPAEYEQSK